ncbi:glutamine amidotransferase-like class 1 domain-containing protein 3, mitochondrial [Phymastichus coffea]|uniref:glutamine amidotransferase-like class 1 domain-containing protein 3, mitochondrial n=1 Tax=Phymastichus coffea TaxID=108790 RepID=UPI00273BA8BD|nr:glutamine amidotransferase-like class 1 domain-containing protein 3, mitochondrial [Phymastichus coffea]
MNYIVDRMLAAFRKTNLLKTALEIGNLSSVNLLHKSHVANNKGSCGCEPPKVAVVLCGCGALDGTEISETISAAIHLSGKNLQPRFYAPDLDICGTVNHLTKDPDESGQPRNGLIEGARLARAAIKPLCECKACDNAALIIPGGFGVARTLSDFASKGCECVVLPEVESIIKDFNCDKKPIGAMCIASVIIAKVLQGVKVTLGMDCPRDKWAYAEAIEKVRQMGANVELKDVKGVTHCKQFNVYSTPAWMDTQASYADIHEGIGSMITGLSQCIK